MATNWITSVPIAHRGLYGGAVPENSLAAFTAAAEAGYAIELDVRVSRDQQLMVIHDATTGRVLPFNCVVAEKNAAELSPLPRLEEVLQAVAGRVPLLIEIKNGPSATMVGPLLLAALRGYDGDYAVESFDPRYLVWFRQHAPRVSRGQLVSRLLGAPQPAMVKWLLRTMVSNVWTRPQFIAYDIRDLPSRNLARWQRWLGVPLVLWTVDTPEKLHLAKSYGANVIFEKIRVPNM